MLRLLYSAAVCVAAPLVLGATSLRGVRDASYRDRLAERLGFTRVRFESQPLWVHAVSVGEVQAAAALVRALQARYQHPLLITTATPTGAQRAAALFGDSVRHAYLPYDTPGAVKRFLNRTQPRIAVIMEREIWPNLFHHCAQRRIPVVLTSARISAASARRHMSLAALFRPALAQNVTIGAQTGADAERYAALGAPLSAVHVTGNIKFDLEIAETVRREGETLRREQFASRPIWVAGSTHEAEEGVLLDAHERVRAVQPDALLILVPRHPNRFAQVAAWLQSRRVQYVARSSGAPVERRHEVLLADTLGELVMLYAAADVAFVGGSLAPVGGHNLLEPAALARPILVGPHNFNAPDIARMFLENGGALQVSSAEELATQLLDLFDDPDRRQQLGALARSVVDDNRGALERALQLIDAARAAPDVKA